MAYNKLKWVLTKKVLVFTLGIGIIALSAIKISTYEWYKNSGYNNKKNVDANNKKEIKISGDEDEDVINYNQYNKSEDAQNGTTNVASGQNSGNSKINKSGEYKDIFKNDLFIGDSITRALITYNMLPSENVCAKIGISSEKLRNYLNNAQKQNPENIFLLCGINDLDGTLTKDLYRKNYNELIKAIKTKFPKSKIYVQSILPLAPSGEQKPPYVKNSHINEYNAIIKDIAKNQNITYLNIASIITTNSLYEGDGMHFKATFYPLWLKYLIDNVK